LDNRRSYHYFSPGKKKAPKGAFLQRENALSRQNADPLSFLVEPIIKDDTVDLGEQREVPAHSHVLARVDARAELPDEDIPGAHSFSTKNFYSSSLSLAVAPVARTSSGLFMSHYPTPPV